MTVGIILTHQLPIPTEILPADTNHLIIDNQLVSMRFGAANDIYVIVHPDQAVFYTMLFSEKVYENIGIIPRVVSTRLSGWAATAWAIGELSQPKHNVYLGYGFTITQPNTYEQLWLGDPSTGIRIARGNDGTLGGIMLKPEAAHALAYAGNNQVEAFRSVERIYSKYEINVRAKSIYTFADYVSYIRNNNE